MPASFLSTSKNTPQEKNDSVEMFKFPGPKLFLNIIFKKEKNNEKWPKLRVAERASALGA